MTRHDTLTMVLGFAISVIAVARATRLVTHDTFPPIQAFRRWWFNQTVGKGGWRAGWAPLISGDDGNGGCPFCFAPYAAAVDLAWAVYWDLPMAWWIVNTWAAVSYLAAGFVVRDEPPAED